MFDTCVTLQQSFTIWRRSCTTELLICSVAGRRGCLPCRPKRNLKTVKDDAVQDRAQPSFSAVFQCSPSVSAPVLSMQPSFSAAFFQCSLLSIQPSFSAALLSAHPFFQCSLLSIQPSFNTAFFQYSPRTPCPRTRRARMPYRISPEVGVDPLRQRLALTHNAHASETPGVVRTHGFAGHFHRTPSPPWRNTHASPAAPPAAPTLDS